ncbi:MAG: helix-turn-helix domain-containing protein [Candidatus Limnocylindrales bacterium]
MDDIRIGRILRALRTRRGWTQATLARQAGVSQQLISLVERGHSSRLAGRTLEAIFGALDARWEQVVSWRGGALDRLLDEAHSRLVEATSSRLREQGWSIEIEVTYSTFGERGSIDILAARASLTAVLSIEVKSELTSIEATLRKIDEKDRLVRRHICAQRFGFEPGATGRLLVLPGTGSTRRRLRASAVVLDAALPSRSVAVRQWLTQPRGELSGIWIVADTNGRGGTRAGGGPNRIRRPRATSNVP